VDAATAVMPIKAEMPATAVTTAKAVMPASQYYKKSHFIFTSHRLPFWILY
jgi:hypothetical protein